MNERRDRMLDEVVAGLTSSPKVLSPKYFYDALGSRLFDAITYLPEYYPTACEREILQEHGAEIASVLGRGVLLLELGSGTSAKVPMLLDRMEDVAAYVPVDIDADTLGEAANRLRRQFPGLVVRPVAADFTHPWTLPELPAARRRVVFYPGSTIGNLDPDHALEFLAGLGTKLSPGDALLIGFDLEKDAAVLELAYDDPAGVTAAFNRNVLGHLNRALGADFDPRRFEHVARWNETAHRIEMHLRSVGEQVVHVGGVRIRFSHGETIHTESSYKYSFERFHALAA